MCARALWYHRDTRLWTWERSDQSLTFHLDRCRNGKRMSALRRSWTGDLVITSDALYQLSYQGWFDDGVADWPFIDAKLEAHAVSNYASRTSSFLSYRSWYWLRLFSKTIQYISSSLCTYIEFVSRLEHKSQQTMSVFSVRVGAGWKCSNMIILLYLGSRRSVMWAYVSWACL